MYRRVGNCSCYYITICVLSNSLIIDRYILLWVNKIRDLGIYIVRSRKLKCSLDHTKRSFHRSPNSIFDRLGRTASEDIILHLVHSKCLPILICGLELCPLTRIDCRSLYFVVMRSLMKLFCTSNSVSELVLSSVYPAKQFRHEQLNLCQDYQTSHCTAVLQ